MDPGWSTGEWLFAIVLFMPSIVALVALNFAAFIISAIFVGAALAIFAFYHQAAGIGLWAFTWLVVWLMLRSQDRERLEGYRHRQLLRALEKAQKAGVDTASLLPQPRRRWWQRS